MLGGMRGTYLAGGVHYYATHTLAHYFSLLTLVDLYMILNDPWNDLWVTVPRDLEI